ncbi:hypothetical protein HMPREF9058_1474 [Actinomyces sp. oral taxon 175 str. F0384]|nr:hypothetical protein HMPREF9058_1474 [Actinomyces sp. oral taxon 175 str. F0384]
MISIASVAFASSKRVRRVSAVLSPPPEPHRRTSPEVNVGHACTVKLLDSLAGGFGNSCHLATIRGEGTDTILQCRVKPGERR